MLRAWIADESGNWVDYMVVLTVATLAGMAVLWGIVGSVRTVGTNTETDIDCLNDMTASGCPGAAP